MPPSTTRSKLLTTSSTKTQVDYKSSILNALSDPSKCDEELTRRLARALQVAPGKPTIIGGSRATQKVNDSDERLRLAMGAANAASQSLGIVSQSGWKALNPDATPCFSTNRVTSIVSSFRLAISLLRELMPCSIDVERVVSSFIDKLITIQLNETALEFLDQLREKVIRIYHESQLMKPAALGKTPLPPVTRYLHLIWYPLPAPSDVILLSVISVALTQALTALAALASWPPASDLVLDAMSSAVDDDNGILNWHPRLPEEYAETMVTRAHRTLAMTFSSSNSPPAILLKLRTWALRCLLYKRTLDPDLFWTQATNYLASFGKIVTKTESHFKAMDDCAVFFDVLVATAQRRCDAIKFMSGSAFNKFCETTLVFSQHGDISTVRRIIRCIKNDTDGVSQPTRKVELSTVEIYATLSQGAKMVEMLLSSDSEPDLVDILTQCAGAISASTTLFVESGFQSNTMRSLEKLRRLCGKVLEEGRGKDQSRETVELVLMRIIEGMELAGRQTPQLPVTMITELVACAVDSLCTLAKCSLSLANPETYVTAYKYLQRGVAILDSHEMSITNELQGRTVDKVANVLRCISSAFWNHAVTLYQDTRYAAAVQFLLPACELGVRACKVARINAKDTKQDFCPANVVWSVLKAHLPKRWELLADCYSKIGDRKASLTYEALIESLKTHSFEPIRLSAASSSPILISLDPTHSRLSSLIKRITHMAVFDLFLTDRASLRHSVSIPEHAPEAVGLLLEWQVAGLDEHLWKPESRPVMTLLLRDALDIYNDKFPVRRARVLLLQLEMAYRVNDLTISSTNVAAEIHALLSTDQYSDKDAALSNFRQQYQAAAHMWMAFHAHRRSEHNTTSIIIHHATLASKLLREIFPAIHTPSATSLKASPKVGAVQAVKVATRTSPRKKAASVKKSFTTPKPRKKITQSSPKAVRRGSSPKDIHTPAKWHKTTVDPHFANLVELLAKLMGLLGHVTLKIQFLNILQRMAGCSLVSTAEEFVRASVDAAVEYLNLGKTQRALAIYAHALAAINDTTPSAISDGLQILLFLRYAEALAVNGNASKSVQLYEEARKKAQDFERPQPRSTADRIRARVQVLVQSAQASRVFSIIQAENDDPHTALFFLRQSARLWNRAFDSLARLSPIQDPIDSNPFDMSSLAGALPRQESEQFQKRNSAFHRTYHRITATDTLQWQIAEGLLHTLFDLARAYFLQGSVRAAEYFIEQARGLADALNSPVMTSRALAKKSELQLHYGSIPEAATCLMEAAELLHDLPGVDAANITRLRALHSQLLDKDIDAKTFYLEAISMVSDLEKTLSDIDPIGPSLKQSLTQSSRRSGDLDVLAPGFIATILKQQIWLQRNEPRGSIRGLLKRLSALPPSRDTKAEELATLAKLALHDAHLQFRSDLFLSSLTESTIAVPMGLSSDNIRTLSTGGRQMLETLSIAETMFWDNLECVTCSGQALQVREAAVSLALIRSFQISLGKSCTNDARVAVELLDTSAAVTLRHEFLDAIEQKFPQLTTDELMWPSPSDRPKFTLGSEHIVASDKILDNNDNDDSDINLKGYWNSVRSRYYLDRAMDRSISTSRVDLLPANWTVVSIHVTEDKNTMFFSRQRPGSTPLLFCVPLERHGRKDEDAEGQLGFDDAMQQFEEILRESDRSAKDAKDILSEDRNAKAAWWAKRVSLDKCMRDLLDNIEFCWLGAFKTIFHEPVKTPPEVMNSLQSRFNKVFHHTLVSDKKRASRMKLDDALVECFASLSPKCRDEELEDLVYFVLDLYQFHGLHVALSEIDMDQVIVELRTVLEEHTTKGKCRMAPVKDAHLFLVLDKNVQGIPWESIPTLRGKSVSRVPSLSFLVDRIELAKVQRESMGLSVMDDSPLDRAVVNPKNTYFVLNPSGDLAKSEARFGAWLKDMKAPAVGWQGIMGRAPSEQELLEAFTKKDLVIYIGHGGAEQYVRSNKIKHLSRCAATMLWGCSSGLMRDMGEFDRTGTPYNYMMAGCPALVACLWDVTDNELDKISRSVFDKLRLDAENVKSWDYRSMNNAPMSLVTAVGQSRDACKLKFLTGAAPVVYGIPFYL